LRRKKYSGSELRNVFNEEFNIAFFAPEKDQCELCIAFKNAEGEEKETLQEKYDSHLKEKELSRLEKEKGQKVK
jgi:hypothetical protein